MSFYGRYHHPFGYTLVKLLRTVPNEALNIPLIGMFFKSRVPQYEFTIDLLSPLTFETAAHKFIQPDRHFKTDMGSIPPFLQFWFPKDQFLLSYLIHDSGCIHGGHWVQRPNDTVYEFQQMTRKEVDDLLYDGVRAEKGTATQARMIWCAVRAYAIVCGKK